MKNISCFLMACCLLMYGCSKDNAHPDDDDGEVDGQTYFEATVVGPVLHGDFEWKGNYTMALEEIKDGVRRAGVIWDYPSGEVRTLGGGITIPPGTGTHKVIPDDSGMLIFDILVNGVALTQKDVTVKVTEYKMLEGAGELHQIERIYGTFEGEVQTVKQAEGQESGLVHTVKGKFGYSLSD